MSVRKKPPFVLQCAVDIEYEVISEGTGFKITPISIALVISPDREYYAEFNISHNYLTDSWTIANVVPRLGDDSERKSRAQISQEIFEFLDPREGVQLTFWSDHNFANDFSMLNWVLLGKNYPPNAYFLNTYGMDVILFKNVDEELSLLMALGHEPLSLAFPGDPHHALSDARVIMGKVEWLKDLEAQKLNHMSEPLPPL